MKEYNDPSPVVSAPPPDSKKGFPLAPPPLPPPKPPSFADHAARMGRELSQVGPLLRAAGVLILVSALLLAAQNGLILSGSIQQATAGGPSLGGQGGQNNSSANSSFSGLVGAEPFFARIALATQLDLAGFSLLGVALILFGVGSRKIEMRLRSTDEVRKVGSLAAAAGIASGVLCFAWVGLTVLWRTALTGSPTGDWTGLAAGFSTGGLSSGGGLPEGVRQFLDTFPRVGLMWILASTLLVGASIAFYLGGRSVRTATGIKIGGAGWVYGAGVSLFGTLVFVMAMFDLIQRVNDASASGGEPNFGDAFLILAVGAGAKLILAPLASIIGFLALASVGARIARFKGGKILVAREDIKAITATPSLPPESGGAASGAFAGALPPPPMGDVVVNLDKKAP